MNGLDSCFLTCSLAERETLVFRRRCIISDQNDVTSISFVVLLYSRGFVVSGKLSKILYVELILYIQIYPHVF